MIPAGHSTSSAHRIGSAPAPALTPVSAASPHLSPSAAPTRRRFLAGGTTLAALGLLTACTPADTAALAPTTPPAEGGVLRYFEPQTWTTLYPPSAGFYPNGGILNNVTARLLYQDARTLELHPWLATELPEVNDDATEFTFRIRTDVTYSDGTPMTAENVVKNFDLYGRGDLDRALPVSEQITNYDGGEVIDERTVRFRFSAPAPGFPQAVSTMNSGLVSDAALDLDATGFGPGNALAVATSGPFYIASEDLGTKLSVRVREDYDWAPPHLEHQGRAFLDGIDYLVNQEYSVRAGALVSGQVDGLRQVEAPDEARIEEKGLRLIAAPTNGINNVISLRSRHPLLQDIRVRRALIHGIDRERIRSKLFTDNYPLADGVLARGAMGHTTAPKDAWVFDPAAAEALLDEAGWLRPGGPGAGTGIREKDGVRLSLRTIVAMPQPRSNEVMTLVQEDFARIGVELHLNEGDWAKQTLDALDLDTIQINHGMVARADYDVLASLWSVKNRDALINYDEGTDTWGDEELENVLSRITGSESAADRQAAAADFQQRVIDEALVLPLFEEPQVFGFRRRVHGFETEPVGRPAFYSTWIDSEEDRA